MSELFVLGVAGSIIIVEFRKAETKNAEKALQTKIKDKERDDALDARFMALEGAVRRLEALVVAQSSEYHQSR